MDITTYNCPNQFLIKVEQFLLKHEAMNNLPLGIVYSLVKQRPEQEIFLATVEDEAGIQLVMIKTSQNLVLASDNSIKEEAVHKATQYFQTNGITLPGIIGEKELANLFQITWQKVTGQTSQVGMRQRIYRLDQVNEIDYSPGQLRLATIDDLSFVTEWVYEFVKVTPDLITMEEAEKLARTSIDTSSMYLWLVDDIPVSMAKKVRPTKNGIVINLVYTPPQFRKRGYASACVATLTKLLLNEGYQFTSLYTDLDNPTSNKIYMEIGYKAIADSMLYKFN